MGLKYWLKMAEVMEIRGEFQVRAGQIYRILELLELTLSISKTI
jgi:hypothetical protein